MTRRKCDPDDPTRFQRWCIEVTSNSEKIKPVALAIVELCLSEGINQSVENSTKVFFKFCSNFLEAFQSMC